MYRSSSSGARNFAGAFLRPVGAAAPEALAALKALAPVLEAIPGRPAGRNDAARLERMLRDAAGEALREDAAGVERAIRLVTLLVRRNLRHLLVPVIREGERIIDAMQGTLEVRLESAGPVDGDFLDALKQRLAAGTGAKEIRIVPAEDPGLLGGYRLLVGAEAFDASMRGRIAQMAADLRAAVPAGGI
jgi:F-type H+-transporting ATPase subunit delta